MFLARLEQLHSAGREVAHQRWQVTLESRLSVCFPERWQPVHHAQMLWTVFVPPKSHTLLCMARIELFWSIVDTGSLASSKSL